MYMSRSPEDAAGDADMITDHDFSPNRGCCFIRPAGFHFWQRMGGGGGGEEGLAVRSWKKMREWSELTAGPRWKTFIRRFGRNRAAGAGGQGKFGYDPVSYARNFDEGQGGQSDDDDGFRPDFPTRYAALPLSAKSSMDLGRDGPSFAT